MRIHIKVPFLSKCLLVKMFRAARKYLISFVEVMHTCLCLTDGKFYIWDKIYWMFAKQRNQKDRQNIWQSDDTKFEILSIALNFSILYSAISYKKYGVASLHFNSILFFYLTILNNWSSLLKRKRCGKFYMPTYKERLPRP